MNAETGPPKHREPPSATVGPEGTVIRPHNLARGKLRRSPRSRCGDSPQCRRVCCRSPRSEKPSAGTTPLERPRRPGMEGRRPVDPPREKLGGRAPNPHPALPLSLASRHLGRRQRDGCLGRGTSAPARAPLTPPSPRQSRRQTSSQPCSRWSSKARAANAKHAHSLRRERERLPESRPRGSRRPVFVACARLLELPGEDPVAADEVREVRGGGEAAEPEVARRGIRVEDAAAVVEVRSPLGATRRPLRRRARGRA
jgi:hypothetical protein